MKFTLLFATLLILGVACSHDSDSPTAVSFAPGTTLNSETASVNVCQNTNVNATGFFHRYRPHWTCGRIVSVGSPDGSVPATDTAQAPQEGRTVF